jgi:hypothetical protein
VSRRSTKAKTKERLRLRGKQVEHEEYALPDGSIRYPITVYRFLSAAMADEDYSCHGCGGGQILFDYGNMISPAEGGPAIQGIKLVICEDCRLELFELLAREHKRFMDGKKVKLADGGTCVLPAASLLVKKEEVA